MIRSILKMWSNNDADWFAEALRLFQEKKIDGIELYNNVSVPLDLAALEKFKGAVVTIHNPHSDGWHDFFLTEEQKPHWEQTKKLADFFEAMRIVVHPARTHTVETFLKNLEKLNDPRIIVENMAGLDIDRQPMQCGATLPDLREITKRHPICFDLEKAVKAAKREGLDYKEFISQGLRDLHPSYFHISGGDSADAMDQHLDIWDGGIDMKWIKAQLDAIAEEKDIFLAFETPKKNGLANDVKNMEYFHSL